MLTQEVHSAWHNLFFNLLPEEVVHLIPIIGLETEKRIESWKLVFGNRTREQAIELVKREWTPKVRHKSRRRREWEEKTREVSYL